MTDLYSDLNVKGKITQKANQADTSLDENQHDVVIVSTLNGRVPSAIPSPDQAGKAIVVNDQGTAYTLGEAGKVDGVKLGSSSATAVTVTDKYAIIPAATGSALGVVQTGTGITNNSGTISVTYGNTAGTACQGNDSRLSDARTPLSHTHGNISNDGKISSNKGSIVITDASTGAIEASGKTIETNKANVTTLATSTIPTSAAVAGAINDAVAAIPDPMIFKGSVGTGGTVTWTNLPQPATGAGPMAGNEGWTYKVITKYTNTGASDYRPSAEVGDTIISDGTAWIVIPSGDVPGGTVTNVATGVGLTGGPITSTGTIKVKLKNGDTASSLASATTTTTASRQYAVEPDSSGYLSVNVPWEDTHQTIKQDGITGATINRYGVCTTAAATATKEVDITAGTFSLENGARVVVKFNNANTATSDLKLKVGTTSAKPILLSDGSTFNANNGEVYKLIKGVCEFTYDDTMDAWYMNGYTGRVHQIRNDDGAMGCLMMSTIVPGSIYGSEFDTQARLTKKLSYGSSGLIVGESGSSSSCAIISSDGTQIRLMTGNTTPISISSVQGIRSTYGFIGDLTGNASTATNVAYSGITSNPITASNVTFTDWLQE